MENMEKLAKNIVGYSCNIKRGEKVWIEWSCTDPKFIECLIKEIEKVGAIPVLKNYEQKYLKYLMKYGDKKTFDFIAKHDAGLMKEMDAVILVKGLNNAFEYSDVPLEKKNLYNLCYNEPVHNKIRIDKKWVLLRFPTDAFAQSSKMSFEEFEKYFYQVCNLDYKKMCKAMDSLKKLMEKTDKVRIVAQDTDLTFRIKGMPAIKCCADKNIPDGECYTAPVKNSINGKIKYNVNMAIDGVFYPSITLTFKNGKVVECDQKTFNKVLDTDAGSRYCGEFSFGLNPYITKPIMDILFDEKMARSIHMAMGNSYSDCDNGNHSAIHIDLIHSHAKEYGGGKIFFDDVLIRENGEFVLPELLVLNPKNLIK